MLSFVPDSAVTALMPQNAIAQSGGNSKQLLKVKSFDFL